jgi:hypothetical protein
MRRRRSPMSFGPSFQEIAREEAAAREAARVAAAADARLTRAETVFDMELAEEQAAVARRREIRHRLAFLVGPGEAADRIATAFDAWATEWRIPAPALDAFAVELTLTTKEGPARDRP